MILIRGLPLSWSIATVREIIPKETVVQKIWIIQGSFRHQEIVGLKTDQDTKLQLRR